MNTRCFKSFFVIVALAIAAPAAEAQADGQSAPGTTVILRQNTPVKLTLQTDLESGVTKEGAQFALTVAEDVVDSSGQILIARGTAAHGHVTWSRRAELLGIVINRPPRLEIAVDGVAAVDKSPVALQATKLGSAGASIKIEDAVKAALGDPIDIVKRLADLIVARNIKVKAGTAVIAYVASDRAVHADAVPLQKITLMNGDTISGRVIGEADGAYVVVTTFGTLRVAKADVRSMQASVPNAGKTTTLVLRDGGVLTGRIVQDEPAYYVFATAYGTLNIDKAGVAEVRDG